MFNELTVEQVRKYEVTRQSEAEAEKVCQRIAEAKSQLATGESVGKWSLVQNAAWEAPVTKGGQYVRQARVSRYTY